MSFFSAAGANVFANQGKIQEGGVFFQPETLEEFLKVQHPNISRWMTLAWFKSYKPASYAHGGTIPGVFTNVIVSTEEKMGIIMFTNTDGFFRAWRTELGVEEIREDINEYLNLYGFPFGP